MIVLEFRGKTIIYKNQGFWQSLAQFHQHFTNFMTPDSVGSTMSLSRLCSTPRNSSMLNVPSLLVSKMWNIISTTELEIGAWQICKTFRSTNQQQTRNSQLKSLKIKVKRCCQFVIHQLYIVKTRIKGTISPPCSKEK